MLASQIDIALERKRTPAAYEELLRSLREDAGRMTQLVSELLTLARADAGQQILSTEELDLSELARTVGQAMQPLAVQRGIQLTTHGEPRVMVLGDQTRLSQLLINLVDNALRYTPTGGTVTVTVTASSSWAQLQVDDTGVGIAAEHLAHLFERFYRADPARTRTDGGSGLGLAIARWIAEAHGGQIGVQSELGRGTTFTVRIPQASSAEPQTERQLLQVR